MNITLHFAGNELIISENTGINISRRGNETHINITNTEGNFAFNAIFEQIQKHLGDDKAFSLSVKQGEQIAVFENMTVAYHLNAGGEVLHFSEYDITRA